MSNNNMDEALNNLSTLFPSIDKVFLEDVYVSSKKDYDKTVDMLLGMGIDMEVGKKNDQKPTQTQKPAPVPTPTKPQQALYPTPGSPVTPHHTSPQLPPPLTPNLPPPIAPTHPHPHQQQPQQIPQQQIQPQPVHNVEPAVAYPPRNYNMPMYTSTPTPPPIMNPTVPVVTSPTPTAPLATNLNNSQVEQKRMETMKQELSIEYQRINDKHKYNLELQQKLEQLSEFTTTEQKKLEDQRTLLNEDKRRFNEEYNARFKALEEEFTRQKEELLKQEEQRAAAAREEEEAKAEAKEVKRRLKAQQKEDSERLLRESEVERNEHIDLLTGRLQEAKLNLENVLQEKEAQINAMRSNYESDVDTLKERIRELERQIKTSEYDTSAEVLSYFSSVVSTLAGGIHAVSLERANNGENGEPLKELKRTFFKTVNDQLNDKLRELE